MKNRQTRPGFTIVETLIVLAVTGALFVAIAATMAGRQRGSEFNQAIQDARSQIEQIIDQVAAGYYPNREDFGCQATGSGINITGGGPDKKEQGTNEGCVFLGKVIQFKISGTDPEELNIFTVAGRRELLGSASTTKPFFGYYPTAVDEASDTISLKYGLNTKFMRVGGTNIGAVGFLMEPGSIGGAGGAFNSGAQPIDLVALSGVGLGEPVSSGASAINSDVKDVQKGSMVNPTSPVLICLASGGTNQSGLITLGGNNKKLSVRLDIKSNKDCS